MGKEAPSTGTVKIKLDDALRKPALKEQKEMYPWRKDYEALDYSSDNIEETEISKEKSTLSHVLLPGLRDTNEDKALAYKKFRAICALLVQAHFNPGRVQIGYKIRLKDNVLYIERAKSKKAPKVALKLKKGAVIEAGNKELKSTGKKLVEKSQREWNDLADAISKGISYDAIVAIYGRKYGNRKLNYAKRKEIWEKEIGKTEFKGSAAQNKEILGFLKGKLAEVTAAAAAAAPAEGAAPAPTETAPAPFTAEQIKNPKLITSLTPGQAEQLLAAFKGGILSLDGLTSLDAATAEKLAAFKGGILTLNGLTSLDAATAKALKRFETENKKLTVSDAVHEILNSTAPAAPAEPAPAAPVEPAPVAEVPAEAAGQGVELSPEQIWLGEFQTRFNALSKLHKGIKWADVEKSLKADPESMKKLQALDEKGHQMNVFGEEGDEFIFASAWNKYEQVAQDHRNIAYDQEGQTLAEKRGSQPKGNAVSIIAGIMGVKEDEAGNYLADPKFHEQLKEVIAVTGWAWLKTDAATRKTGKAVDGGSEGISKYVANGHNDTGSFRAALRVKKV